METFLDEFFIFWTRMFNRFREKDEAEWEGWADISEKEFVRRAVKNATAGDYIDAANLCFLAHLIRELKVRKKTEEYRRLEHL